MIRTRLINRSEELTKEYDTNDTIRTSIAHLVKDTITLTKKQRKWIKNRIFTNEELLKRTFTFDV
jgi:tRNA A37 N6-isopentenylltransferase MiaA